MQKTRITARELDEKLKTLVQESQSKEAEIARALLEMKRRGLFRYLGYPRVQDYAWCELDISRGKARALVETAEALEKLPKLEAAFRAGDVSWTKARTVARVATPDTDEHWLGRARALSSRGLEREVAEAKGEKPRVRITLELSETEAADLEAAITALREERDADVPLGEAVAEIARRSMGPPVERPGYQVVLHRCPTCEATTRVARDGELEAAPEDVVAAESDCEILDLTAGGEGTRRCPIRPSVRRAVIARDRGRCVHCGTRGWRHIHHLDPARGDVDALVLICSACHKRLVHGGLVQIERPGTPGSIREAG